MSDEPARGGWALTPINEWTSYDPFGRIKPADDSATHIPVTDTTGAVLIRAPRNGYASFGLLVTGTGTYRIRSTVRGGPKVEFYRAWYHRMAKTGGMAETVGGEPRYVPDALIPFGRNDDLRLPDPDNRIEGQTTQQIWVDIHVPRDARPGLTRGKIVLESSEAAVELPLKLQISDKVLPDQPCVQMDHNSYGSRWLPGLYPEAFRNARSTKQLWHKSIDMLHHYYRLAHEHRGLFHNLGYGHSGDADPIYAPDLTGSGRALALENWELFDRHYGPLLEGSAFAKRGPGMPPPKRVADPIWGVYTPINPGWPASYLAWGEEGYEVAFARGIGQFDAHFREKGWTRSNVDFFFNHKKRYRWFEWDGDEPKFAKDHAYHLEMGRLLHTVSQDSPVQWRYRMDASWQMKNEFDCLRGTADFWVCGGFLRWYPEEVRQVAERGDIVFWYGGTPEVDKASSSILENVFKTWGRGVHGFCAWLTVSPGKDPWFACDGAATGSMYPGERFGISGPIPSIRLKVQRNGIQDVDLIDQAARQAGRLKETRGEITGSVPIALWEKPPSGALELPPEDWDNHNLATEIEPGTLPMEEIDPMWWAAIRDVAYKGEG